MLPAYTSGLRIDLNHKKWGSLINLCPCLCSVHHPTYSSPPIIPSPISPPAPSLYHSIRIACVWILMLITPRLKIAVQSVISPRYVLMKHTLHIQIHKGWYHKRWVFVVLHNRSLNQGSGLCGIASFYPKQIFPQMPFLNMADHPCQNEALHKLYFWQQPTVEPESPLMGLMLLFCGRWGNTLWFCGLVRTVKVFWH